MSLRLSTFALQRLNSVVGLLAVLVIGGLLLTSGPARAQEPKVIHFHTAEWEQLTNRDGSGLYHEILNAVFNQRGYTVETTYFPFKRALLNVSLGEADIAGGTVPEEPHVLSARHPIWESRISVLFHKSKLPLWQGRESLPANTTVAPPGFSGIAELTLHEVATRDQALNMLLNGRMEYYVDEHETLSKLKSGETNVFGFERWRPPSGVEELDWSLYEIRDVKHQALHMVFEDSDRGRMLRDIFDREIERLHQTGELAAMYEKWGFRSRMPKCVPTKQ